MDELLPLLAEARLPTDRPFTTAAARAAGVDDGRLRRLCREGQLRRVLRGVYVDAAAPDDLLTRSVALSLAVPPDAVVTDETAGWLHGAQVLAAGDHLVLPPLKVFRLPGATRVRRPEASGGERTLAAHDLQRVHGVLVTTPLRTALDLGRLAPRDRALSSLDSLMRVSAVDRDDLRRELPRFRGARGVVQLRALVPLADPLAASPGESVLRLRWLDAGLPAPVLQVAARRHGTRPLPRRPGAAGAPLPRRVRRSRAPHQPRRPGARRAAARLAAEAGLGRRRADPRRRIRAPRAGR